MNPRRIALVGLAAVCFVVAKPDTDASTQTRNTGRLIAFVRPLAQYPDEDLFLVNQSGQRVRRLTRLAKEINDPAWSPDGRQLAFEISDDRRDGGGLWVMKADGSGARRVAQVGQEVTWSPNAKRIALVQYDRFDVPSVFTANADGLARRQLVADATDPAWSPDGRWIAFLRDFASTGVAENDIFVTPVQGGRPRRLTHTPNLDEGRPAWSPDGRQLLYAATRGYGDFALHVMKADGTDRRLLMHGFHFWHPAWSPDGQKIVFSSAPHLYVANADGSGKRRLVRNGFDPAWRPVP